ncbi:hypothetical protein JOM56_005421 [Amanita muscaria]
MKSHSGHVQISQQPLAAHGPNMCCSSSRNEKQGHVHQPCQRRCRQRRVWWVRLLVAMAAVFFLLGVFYAVFSKGSGAEGVWESVVGLVKRATSSTTSTSNSSPFVQNKLYLIVAIVGFVVVVILALMLSAWCCRGSFENPLCCPCYLCACCGGLVCLECIGCGLCAVAGAEVV